VKELIPLVMHIKGAYNVAAGLPITFPGIVPHSQQKAHLTSEFLTEYASDLTIILYMKVLANAQNSAVSLNFHDW